MKWRVLKYRSYSAFENMAIDEAIFRETIRNQTPPTLRFFGWYPSAVSIGYFQDLKSEIDVEHCKMAGIDVVRRMTGGKAVYHHDEVTYSLTAASSEKLFPDDIFRTYEIISRCLSSGLSILGINAHLAALDSASVNKKSEMTSSCFSVPSGKELLVANKKICGSAQIRTRGGFLQHGSVLMTFDALKAATLTMPSCSSEMCLQLRNSVTAVNELIAMAISAEDLSLVLQKGFTQELGIDLSEEPLTSTEQNMTAEFMKKYKSGIWNWERKKETYKIF